MPEMRVLASPLGAPDDPPAALGRRGGRVLRAGRRPLCASQARETGSIEHSLDASHSDTSAQPTSPRLASSHLTSASPRLGPPRAHRESERQRRHWAETLGRLTGADAGSLDSKMVRDVHLTARLAARVESAASLFAPSCGVRASLGGRGEGAGLGRSHPRTCAGGGGRRAAAARGGRPGGEAGGRVTGG